MFFSILISIKYRLANFVIAYCLLFTFAQEFIAMLAVTILGNNSALPAFDRHPTAQVVTLDDNIFLVDCGEGTQMQLSKYKVRRSRINHIFISHLHGDHYFGLIGLITSMGLLGREQPLHLHAPSSLQDIILLQLKVADTVLPFALQFHPLLKEGIIVQEEKFKVSCFKAIHRIECWGFKFEQVKAPRKINTAKTKMYDVPAAFYDYLKKGEDYITKSGELIKNELLTDPGIPPKSYAYAADTIYNEAIIEHIYGVDILYHETTYLKDLEERAAKRFHCTTTQAASIACKAQVKKLLIGHFSSKYEKLDEFEKEACEVFENAELALEGVTYRAS
jgi:ribonuclease Z